MIFNLVVALGYNKLCATYGHKRSFASPNAQPNIFVLASRASKSKTPDESRVYGI